VTSAPRGLGSLVSLHGEEVRLEERGQYQGWESSSYNSAADFQDN